jgi:hypothetical protein
LSNTSSWLDKYKWYESYRAVYEDGRF